MASRLRTLRLDIAHLGALWSPYPPLSVLQSLRIDVATVFDLYSPYTGMNDDMAAVVATAAGVAALLSQETGCLECPSLEEIAIAATRPVPTTVKSHEIALLGVALGQQDREQRPRVRLMLAGISFAAEVDQDLLIQVFSESAVELRDFPGWVWDGGAGMSASIQ